MTRQSAYRQVLDYANRANPYPLYAQLRQTPVARYEDGSYVVSTHREIVALLHDPRISSDMTKGTQLEPDLIPGFITLDPPEHGRLRRMAMRHFGPPHRAGWIDGMRDKFADMVERLIDDCRGRGQIDIVDDLAYPLPVSVICDMLGSRSRTNPGSSAGHKTSSTANSGHPNSGSEASKRSPRCGNTSPKSPRPIAASRGQHTVAVGHRRQPRRPDEHDRDRRHGSPAAHRRPRNYRQPDRQWDADPTAASGGDGPAAPRTRLRHPVGRGTAPV
ncbi:putative cytochrome P450 reductase [Mycobacterium kansasii]|uniref:Putative cytochrome P450 reductase n=1 Tax=Mycobacterium kansasii TaxID=1768 RepID=A0A1V3X314_MYCKA|nr:putative cytochrome P450 reductase [Mycobacterium kansasii]